MDRCSLSSSQALVHGFIQPETREITILKGEKHGKTGKPAILTGDFRNNHLEMTDLTIFEWQVGAQNEAHVAVQCHILSRNLT